VLLLHYLAGQVQCGEKILSRFGDAGFLAEDMEGVSVAFNSAYSEYLQVCRELNPFSHNLQYKLAIHNEDLVEILFAILLKSAADLPGCPTGCAARNKTTSKDAHSVHIGAVVSASSYFKRSFLCLHGKAEEHKQLSAINKLIGYKGRNGIYDADLAMAKELAKGLGTKISRKKLPKVNVLDCVRKQTLRIDMIQFMP